MLVRRQLARPVLDLSRCFPSVWNRRNVEEFMKQTPAKDPGEAVFYMLPFGAPEDLYFSEMGCKARAFSRTFSNSRKYSTKASGPSFPVGSANSENSDSIFSPTKSAWDHVFLNVKGMPPLLPSAIRNPHREAPSEPGVPPGRIRRQLMTAREISAFDDMFNMIFNAVTEQQGADFHGGGDGPMGGVGIGRGPQGQKLGDLYGRLRRHSKRLKWTSESDEQLDRKKEEIELCDTDQQLLEWAMREVFGESKRYEEAARKAVTEAAASGSEPETFPMLQPETYPYLVAQLMRVFRDKYNDPHLALSIFDHARHLSIPSYVFGCTTPAYNELIETRWRCFRDLKGVHDALEEMTVNGVDPDSRTRMIVETLRREVGERNLWEEENDLGSGEVWKMLAKIETLIVREPKGSQKKSRSTGFKRRWSADDEEWKRAALHPQATDGWEFGRWEDKQGNSRNTDFSARRHNNLDNHPEMH